MRTGPAVGIRYGCSSMLVVLAFSCVGCVAKAVPAPKSQLEIRASQTREYQSRDQRLVMKAVVDVLQDDGYIVNNAVPELGLIAASKDLELDQSGESPLVLGLRWALGSGGEGDDDSIPRSANVEVSVNVSEHGAAVRVRANFRRRTLNSRGGVVDTQPIEDPAFYQEFFSKVDKGVFIRREKL